MATKKSKKRATKPAAKRNRTVIKAKRVVMVNGKKRRNSTSGKVASVAKKVTRAAAGAVQAAAGSIVSAMNGKKKKKTTRKRNVEQGYYDRKGQFHPVRSSTDYSPAREAKGRTFSGEVFARDKRTRQWHLIPLGKTKWPSKSAAIAAANQETERRGKRRQYAAFKAVPLGQEPNPKSKSVTARSPRKSGQSRRRNGSTAEANRRNFAGAVTGYKDLYFPASTPTELSTLGPLVSLVTEAGTLKPVKGAAYLCEDARHRLHLGITNPNGVLFDGPAQSFGKLKRVEYTCKKPHLGYPETVTWFHDFEGALPTLKSDGKGGLKIVGGGYTVKREGITG